MDHKHSDIPPNGWLSSVPLELHGHRKKLDFFIRSIDLYCMLHKLEPLQVSVIEFGCGNGRNISLPIAELGYQVTGVDLHEPSIDYANKINSFNNVRFICQDAAEFSGTEKFHVVVLSDILEHVKNPAALLQLASRVLIDMGMVLICVPNGYGPSELERKFIESTGIDSMLSRLKNHISRLIGQKRIVYNYDSGHIQFFRMSEILSLIEDAGFYIDEWAKGALFGGGITYPLGKIFPFIVKPSLRLADFLHYYFVSTWYFRCFLK